MLIAGTIQTGWHAGLRDMAWLDAGRMRAWGGGLAIAMLAAFALFLNRLQGGYDADGSLLGGDFVSFWAASRLLLSGLTAQVYDPVVHGLAELPVLRKDYAAFYYPPTYLILCWPLGLLGFFQAYVVFLGASGLALIATLRAVVGSNWVLVGLLGFPAIYLNIMPGQNAFLTATLLGVSLHLMDRRPRLAGVLLGVMVIKPHLALAVPVALIATGRWRVLASAALTASGLVAASVLLFGWDTWSAFLVNARDARATLEYGAVGFSKMQSVFAALRWLGVGVTAAYAVHGAVAAAAIAALVWAGRRCRTPAEERSLIVLACLTVTPFSLFYDMTLLALPLGWLARAWWDKGFPPWSKPVLGVTLLAPAVQVFWQPVPFGLPVILLLGGFLLARTRYEPASLPSIAR
jgi:Glycosyltransferase family 87